METTTFQARTRRWMGAARALLTALALVCAAGPLHAADNESRVVMLYGLDPYLPPFLALDKAMRASLVGKTGGQLLFFSESLDAQRVALEALEPELAALLAKKYKNLRIGVVVAVSRTALEFFQRHGEQIWPGARVVYVGFLGYEFKPSALPPGGSAVVSILDAAGTIDVARRLQPGARRIVVVSGVAEVDRTAEKQAREALAKVDSGIKVEFLSGLPLAELEDRIAEVPADSIIIYLVQFRDRDGRPYEPFDVLRDIVKNSRAPVYGAAEDYIGLGVAAGSVASYASRGQLIGEQVRRALAGEMPGPEHVVLAAPNRCVADARALERWSLDRQKLPGDCEVRFAEIPIWRQYWWQIVLTLAVVAAQTVLIAALLVSRRRRRIAETELLKRSSETAHMNRRVVMGELAASIAHELNQPLGAIYNNAGAAQLLIKRDPPELDTVAEILDDIKRDDKHASEVIARIRKMLRKTATDVRDMDLNETIADTVKLLGFNATDKGVSLHADLEPGLAHARADRVQIQQVILNLALNAIEAMADKPSKDRNIVITSRRANAEEAEVSVTDSGGGIPADLIPRIFEPFVTSKEGGMGLGLSISKTIVEAHGGRIWAENVPGGGAAVRFTLPFDVGQRP